MLRFIFCLSIFVVVAEASCPLGWYRLRNSCYYASRTFDSTWAQAEVYCKAHGGYLAHVNDAAEDNFLAGLAVRNGGYCVWLGATDIHSEGKWKSSLTHRPLTFIGPWGRGQPDNYQGNENCLCLFSRQGYHWNDWNCNRRSSFICEKRA